MAIEDIFRALEEQAEDDVKAILDGAKAQAAGIAEDADAQAQEVQKKMISEAEAASRTTSMHKLNAARLNAKKQVAAVKGSAIDEVFDKAVEALGDIRGESSYPGLFEKLLDEALAGIDEAYVVLVDARDKELAEKLMSAREGTVETGIETAGGVVVTTHGGRVARRNTLEDRIEKLRHLSRSDVAETLLER